MATTEQIETTRNSQPVVRRSVKSVEELIERFHDPATSVEECHGLLSRLAIWCEYNAFPGAVRLLG
jgi:hypothetical protein